MDWNEKIRRVRGSEKNCEIFVSRRRKPPCAEQPQQVAGDQVTWRVHVAVDEVVALQFPQAAGVVDEAQVAVGLAGTADAGDLVGHPGRVGDHVERGAVREVRPVRRVEPDQIQPVGHRLVDRREQLVEQLRHGQHGRAGVELVPADREPAGATARRRFALDHGDLASGRGEPQRAGEAAEPGADDDDALGGPSTLRMAPFCPDG